MNKVLLSSKNMCWCTPQDFFDKLDSEFGFRARPRGNEQNSKMCSVLHA